MRDEDAYRLETENEELRAEDEGPIDHKQEVER